MFPHTLTLYLVLKSFQTGLQLLNSARHKSYEATGRDKGNRWSMRHQEMMTPDVLWGTTGIWIRLWLAMSSSFLFVPVDWRKDKYTHTHTHTHTHTWIYLHGWDTLSDLVWGDVMQTWPGQTPQRCASLLQINWGWAIFLWKNTNKRVKFMFMLSFFNRVGYEMI